MRSRVESAFKKLFSSNPCKFQKRHSFSLLASQRMTTCLLFDLDGTLYDIDNGYLEHIRSNIFRMMVEKGYSPNVEHAEELWQPLFKKHNQSFKGLREGGYPFEADEYWTNHRAGFDNFFSHDEDLVQMLKNLPQKKVIFTNCREKEAIQIMKVMGIYECFDGVYGSDFMGDVCKPQKESFEMVLQSLQVLPENVVYFEDSVKNLRTAQQLGMQCVLVMSATARDEGAHIMSVENDDFQCTVKGFEAPITVISTLNDGGKQLRAALPKLFTS